MKSMRAPNWCITSWKEPAIPENDKIQYYCHKKEICPKTNKEHWHVYIEFKEKITMCAIKKIFNDEKIHCEPRKGTQQQAIDYVLKEETKAGEPVFFGIMKHQGKRSDIDEIYDDIANGDTLKEILYNHKGNALRMMHAIEKGALIYHGFNALDSWILLKRKVKKDPLDEKLIDDIESKLLSKH